METFPKSEPELTSSPNDKINFRGVEKLIDEVLKFLEINIEHRAHCNI